MRTKALKSAKQQVGSLHLAPSADGHSSQVLISVTDRCNLRCAYCMPEDGVPKFRHQDVLRYEEIVRIVS